MLLIKGGLVLAGKDGFEKKDVLINGGIINGIGEITDIPGCEIIDAEGCYVAPGYIGIHNHGANGSDTMDATYDALDNMSSYFASKGVTGFLPTTMTAQIENILRALRAVKEAMDKGTSGAAILGANVEGPFINAAHKGAHPEDRIINPGAAEMEQMMEASGGNIRLMTIAPEKPGAFDIIKAYRKKGVAFSAGHSAMTYDEAINAFENGITHVTHLFNAMKSLHHREPGLVGAAMDSDLATAELIVDGIHLHPAVIRMAVSCKGAEGIAIITDSTMATGLAEGTYHLGGQTIIIKDGAARLTNGVLAGSTLTMDDAVRNAVYKFGLGLPEALRMASETPARVIGLGHRKGSIAAGKDADIIILDKDLAVKTTIVGGKVVWKAN